MITHHFERKIFINNELHGVIHIICLSYEFIMNFCMYTLDFFCVFIFRHFRCVVSEKAFYDFYATNYLHRIIVLNIWLLKIFLSAKPYFFIAQIFLNEFLRVLFYHNFKKKIFHLILQSLPVDIFNSSKTFHQNNLFSFLKIFFKSQVWKLAIFYIFLSSHQQLQPSYWHVRFSSNNCEN